MKPILRTALTVGLGFISVLGLSACASIVHGTKQTISVRSAPSNALIELDGHAVGKTPKTVKLSRKSDHELSLSLPGYKTETIHFDHEMSGWFLGNLFFGGLIGIIIDASNGAMYHLTASELQELSKGASFKFNEDNNQLTIVLVSKANPAWRKIGSLSKAH
jgi:hypothetical protein